MNEGADSAAPGAGRPPGDDAPTDVDADAQEPGPARALTLHVLRMIETRMDAAGIAIGHELRGFSARLQLRLVAGVAAFLALWAGIVLLAIALPEAYRIPVLAGVVAAFAIAAIWAYLAAKRGVTENEVGSLRWFLDGLKLDLEVLSRTLSHRRDAPPTTAPRNPPHDLAA